MQIVIKKKKEDYVLNFKYVAICKNILVFSDGKLGKKEKNKFYKKNSIISKSLNLYELNKDIPNSFYFIKDHSVYCYDKEINCEIKFDNKDVSSCKVEEFFINDNHIALTFKCYAAAVKELLFFAKNNIIAEPLSDNKIVVYNRSKLKIRFTKK